jgi:hypothetical protein
MLGQLLGKVCYIAYIGTYIPYKEITEKRCLKLISKEIFCPFVLSCKGILISGEKVNFHTSISEYINVVYIYIFAINKLEFTSI